jgi:hypothetical protein
MKLDTFIQRVLLQFVKTVMIILHWNWMMDTWNISVSVKQCCSEKVYLLLIWYLYGVKQPQIEKELFYYKKPIPVTGRGRL